MGTELNGRNELVGLANGVFYREEKSRDMPGKGRHFTAELRGASISLNPTDGILYGGSLRWKEIANTITEKLSVLVLGFEEDLKVKSNLEMRIEENMLGKSLGPKIRRPS